MKRIAYLNKSFVPLHKAKISILDRGFLYGDGVFETMRAYNGTVFRFEKHLKRLSGSLKSLGIPAKVNKDIIHKLLKKNKLKNAYVKIIVTRGENHRPTVAIYALPYKPTAKKRIKAIVSGEKSNEMSSVTGKKTLNYLQNFLCRDEARKKGYDDAILVNTKGFISEATTSNIFLVKGKKIYTPAIRCGILPGITREEVIWLAAKNLNKKVKETFIKPKAIESADEIFFTNSLVEILPVVKVGKRIVGNGKPGPITKKLKEAFKNAVKG